ncbi:DUF4227 family protein [Paenibacillus sp. YPG26]|uniref:DUF4227 family protein n=1 Tax=Paenibacillus sp. YPG26 TaxID=2878915 RepID=UPI0020402A38|nr:DUF4227 family protein [Paenibacillus sp. YPG26]USB34713.1 YqzK family protein [Paenibacillus sp. YPG26]
MSLIWLHRDNHNEHDLSVYLIYTVFYVKVKSGIERGRGMVISLRKLLMFIKLTIIFLGLSLFLYKMIGWFDTWIFPADKYGTPQGAAVKAFHHRDDGSSDGGSPLERLRTFYWYGE